MKKKFLLILAAGMLSNIAVAQTRERPKHECLRICMATDFPRKTQLNEKLDQLKEKKKNETSISKKKQITEEEQSLVEKYEDYVDQTCRYICSGNPEK